jgi:hypothetical protein
MKGNLPPWQHLPSGGGWPGRRGGDAAAASPQAQQAGQRAMFGIVGGRPGLRRLLVSYFLAASGARPGVSLG